MTVRAVVYDAQGVRVTDVPEPALLSPDDALVDVTHTAVCGTDLHLLAHPDGVAPGTVLGHEFLGRVREVGSRVSALAPGDVVLGADYTACGSCWWCRQGRHWQCAERRFFGTGTAFGPELQGGQAEVVRVPFAQTCLRALPPGVRPDHALVLGDTLATGYAAATALRAPPGGVVAVVGGGPVGQLAAVCAQVLGAGHVVVVEPVEERRTLADRQGSIAVAPEDARDLVRELSQGRGADGVIDAIGAPVGLDLSLDVVRAAGSVVSVGVPAESTYRLDARGCFEREIALRFVIGNFMRDSRVLLDLVSTGLVRVDELIDSGYRLDQAPEAYDDMRQRRTLKAVMRT